jgi:hypothetical protein
MATTDTRPGFRLPWSSDRADADPNGTDSPESSSAPVADADAEAPGSVADDAASATIESLDADASETIGDTVGSAAGSPEIVETPAPVAVAPAPVRKPNKFLADLTKAMQATAESARAESLERFTADAKAATEKVHATAADEATELRRSADEDVASIREWSKAEISRIREMTESRISGRKSELETELEAHAGVVERRIEQVTARVAAFEAEMAAFYERLATEEDPTRFASMAEQLPEAPSLESSVLDALPDAPPTTVEQEPVIASIDMTAETDTETAPDATDAVVETTPDAGTVEASSTDERTAELSTDEAAAAEAEVATSTDEADPRLAAIGLTPDFAAAEAEAAVAAEAGGDETAEEIPTIADEVLAARLAGLVPDETNGTNPLVTTKVIVTGLVSVASIAGFKRHLARLQGVTTVGVSSGPEGEFIFSVHHLPVADLSAGITELPGFDARVTEQVDGQITVSARDPESHD